MTANQYRDAIARLGLSQVRAGVLLGVSLKTSQRYAKSGAPEPVARLLRFLIAAKVTPDEFARLLARAQ